MASAQPHVLILGAGLAGLALAQCLRKQGIPFQIYERDAFLHARGGGWAISIHTILSELKDCLPNDLPPIDSVSHLWPLDLPAQMCFYARQGKAYVESSTQHPVLRANRQKFREWLATNVDVQWGKKVSSIKRDGDHMKLSFEDGTVATGSVLVGADGVQSQGEGHHFGRSTCTRLTTSSTQP